MYGTLDGASVLVTGAAGFMGSHLVRRLVSEGAAVHGVDMRPAPWWRLADVQEELTVHCIDLGDEAAVRELLQATRPVKIFHLAGIVNVARSLDMLDSAARDLAMTMNLLRNLGECDCDCFVQTGTCEEYGDNVAPFREDQLPRPVSPYSAGKASATMFATMLHRTRGLPVVVVRPFLTYGPMQDAKLFIPSAISAALREEPFAMTEGKQTREFNYVTDIVDGFVKAATTPEALGEIINLGNGVEHTLRDVVTLISRLSGKPLAARFGAVPYRAGEVWHFYSDSAKARRLLGWEPTVSLERGLADTIEWCRNNPASDGGAKA